MLKNWIKKKLVSFKIRKHKSIQGFIIPCEAVKLFELAACIKKNNSLIVEIGSWKGKSTFCLALGLMNGHIAAIDGFNCMGDQESSKVYSEAKGNISLLEQFKSNMSRLKVSQKIIVCQGNSQDFINDFSSIDLLFIDGDHSIDGCYTDFLGYSDAIVPGGYIVFHDYDPTRKELGPTWVIENKILTEQEYSFVERVGSLWIGQKRNGK
ncbi:MAG: class I SAM-dependent methyltransferase [Limnothrix sp. RL_2_0]|nr:class I SAM-dependent methyltransferase [Limnothrix sp. RL_2_0]